MLYYKKWLFNNKRSFHTVIPKPSALLKGGTDMSTLVKVTLPNDEIVEAYLVISEALYVHGTTGYAHPRFMAPYADQPRRYEDPAHRERLKQSVMNKGVRDNLVVTPMSMAPWATTASGDEDLPFLIVSGNTRRGVAMDDEVQLEAVPFEVRIYPNKAAFDTDARILNGPRANLTELEEGFDFAQLIAGGKRVADIARETGYTRPVVDGRLALTRLAPDLMDRISPSLSRRQRLAFGFAAALGSVKLPESTAALLEKLNELGAKSFDLSTIPADEQRFLLQRSYYEFCKRKKWGGKVSETFIKTGQYPPEKTGGGASHGLKSGRSGMDTAAPGETDYTRLPPRAAYRLVCQIMVHSGLHKASPAQVQNAMQGVIGDDLEKMVALLGIIGEKHLPGLQRMAERKPKTTSSQARATKTAEAIIWEVPEKPVRISA